MLRAGSRTVTLTFGATLETRQYALEATVLRRVTFPGGATLTTQGGGTLVVATVTQRQGLLYYGDGSREVCETELSPTLQFSTPRQRLLAGQFDEPGTFELRLAALERQHLRRSSPVRGFLGGRIDLIPHQLAIASQVTGRLVPRVLLADEVGLGKTIEACLILHRLLATGRARRVLILVPDSLVHQWFLELMRRFNLWFHIFDEARCAALGAQGANPFLDDQLVLCSLSLFTSPGPRLDQALAAGWDLLVVDEAHHLSWSEDQASPGYAAVERLAAGTPSLLLLTATPEQLGVASHFARLRLLDPDRFYDLQAYTRQAQAFGEVAQLAERLAGQAPLPLPDRTRLSELLGLTPLELQERLSRDRQALLGALLDQHGTGRVMFRNTRARVPGFPRRLARMAPLEAPGPQDPLAQEFQREVEGIQGPAPNLVDDPRIHWLVDLLNATGEDKLLVICRTRSQAEAIEKALHHHMKVKAAVFHEGLTLVRRDRGAQWFAEKEGARLLITSEIGSEGRNFQFAHALVLFDLPLDPGLLEQRIGRLDRIGQASDIQVHVPFSAGSAHEVLARWYHEGLNAFEENVPGARELMDQFRTRILDLARVFPQDPAASRGPLEALLAQTRQARAELTTRLEAGRDRLLELNAQGGDGGGPAAQLVQDIQTQDADGALDRFMLACFDHFFIPVEEVAPRTYQLGSMGVLAQTFPGLSPEGLTVTCDRQRALAREDIQFLTWDHPLVTGALDQVLGSPQGNCTLARWVDPKVSGLYLEAIYLLECLAPPGLNVDRFLPPTPLRVLVDHRGRDLSALLPAPDLARRLGAPGGATLRVPPEWLQNLLPPMLDQADALARRQGPERVAKARKAMSAQLTRELGRLEDLRKVNGGVRPEEIELLRDQRTALDRHLDGARVRLDALRLILRGPR